MGVSDSFVVFVAGFNLGLTVRRRVCVFNIGLENHEGEERLEFKKTENDKYRRPNKEDRSKIIHNSRVLMDILKNSPREATKEEKEAFVLFNDVGLCCIESQHTAVNGTRGIMSLGAKFKDSDLCWALIAFDVYTERPTPAYEKENDESSVISSIEVEDDTSRSLGGSGRRGKKRKTGKYGRELNAPCKIGKGVDKIKMMERYYELMDEWYLWNENKTEEAQHIGEEWRVYLKEQDESTMGRLQTTAPTTAARTGEKKKRYAGCGNVSRIFARMKASNAPSSGAPVASPPIDAATLAAAKENEVPI